MSPSGGCDGPCSGDGGPCSKNDKGGRCGGDEGHHTYLAKLVLVFERQ